MGQWLFYLGHGQIYKKKCSFKKKCSRVIYNLIQIYHLTKFYNNKINKLNLSSGHGIFKN